MYAGKINMALVNMFVLVKTMIEITASNRNDLYAPNISYKDFNRDNPQYLFGVCQKYELTKD